MAAMVTSKFSLRKVSAIAKSVVSKIGRLAPNQALMDFHSKLTILASTSQSHSGHSANYRAEVMFNHRQRMRGFAPAEPALHGLAWPAGLLPHAWALLAMVGGLEQDQDQHPAPPQDPAPQDPPQDPDPPGEPAPPQDPPQEPAPPGEPAPPQDPPQEPAPPGEPAPPQHYRSQVRIHNTHDLYLVPVNLDDNADPNIVFIEAVNVTWEEYCAIRKLCNTRPTLRRLPYKANRISTIKAISLLAGIGLGYYCAFTVGEFLKELVAALKDLKMRGFSIHLILGLKLRWSDMLF